VLAYDLMHALLVGIGQQVVCSMYVVQHVCAGEARLWHVSLVRCPWAAAALMPAHCLSALPGSGNMAHAPQPIQQAAPVQTTHPGILE